MVTDATDILHGEGPRRARPRLWHHDYLHLRPLAQDLRRVLGQAQGDGNGGAAGGGWRVLDLGCGASPYRTYFPGSLQSYVRVDLDPEALSRCTGKVAQHVGGRIEVQSPVDVTGVLGQLDRFSPESPASPT